MTFPTWMLAVFLPEAVVATLWPRRETCRGHMIDPKAWVVSRLVEQLRKADSMPTVAESRKQLETMIKLFDSKGPRLAEVTDLPAQGAAGQLRARLYRKTRAGSPVPAMVYFHGGGFVQGSMESHDNLCRKLAHAWGGAVISVDYRLAPEHPFPAAIEDGQAVFRWLHANAEALKLDPARIGVGGDSAGATIAAVVAQQARAPAPAFQMLAYPMTDAHMTLPSMTERAHDPVLSRDRIEWFLEMYSGGSADLDDPRFSPLLALDLSGLPPALVLTAGFDPLADDGRVYAERMRNVGVPVEDLHFPGQVHGFLNATRVIPQGGIAIEKLVSWLGRTA
ncbi:MAG: alpha/beta hydrolase [Paracoccaceae bacterium]|nr:alpha/beta hydrolase [Paracoccaceae bacterium]